jgi:hypothetical protein
LANNGITTLDGAITDSATTINIASAAALGLSDATTDAYITVIDATTWRKNPATQPETLEIIKITAISTNQLTVVRGQDGTSGTAFNDGDYVELRLNAAVVDRVTDALTDGTDELNIGSIVVATDVTLTAGDLLVSAGMAHIITGSSGATASTSADELIVESGSAGNGGISILTPNNKFGILYFGSPGDTSGASLLWQYDVDSFFVGSAKVGADLVLRGDNQVTNLTLSGASTFELATFVRTVNTTNGPYQVAGTNVVGTRKTGWGAPTGTATRTTFATSTVTTEQLAERVHALIDDLTTHGLIGT